MIKRFIFGSDMAFTPPTDLALFCLRVFAGFSMMLGHGYAKFPPPEGFIGIVGQLGFPQPLLFAWLAALSEFIGGGLLAIGLFTRPAALSIVFTMCVAAFLRHGDDPFSKQELSLLYLFVGISFFFVGGGRLSVDRLIRGK